MNEIATATHISLKHQDVECSMFNVHTRKEEIFVECGVSGARRGIRDCGRHTIQTAFAFCHFSHKEFFHTFRHF